jgi:heat shock protein HslJ
MVAAFALGGASCSPSPTSPTGVPDSGTAGSSTETLSTSLPAGWADATWRLESIQTAGQAAQLVPNGASYEATFADNRISTKVDCNRCTGALSIAGNTVTIAPLLACTRAACPTMAFERVYLELLTGESNARIDGDSLTLSSPRGELRFRR